MIKLFASCIAASVAVLAPAAAGAETLTFEGQPNTIYAAPTAFGSFTIGNVAGDEQHFHAIDSTAFAGFVVSDGTGVLYNDRDTRIFVTATDGSLFTLDAFDASATGASDGSTGATQLVVSGFVGGVQTYTATFGIGPAFGSHAFANFGFDTVVFDGLNGGGGFELDNVVLNNATAGVPEPATWGMMLLGFGGMGFAMRRRPKTATRIRFA